MKTRIISAVIALPLVVLALIQPYLWIWGIIAFLASVFGLYEFYKATDLIKSKPLCFLGYFSAAYFALSWFVDLSIIPFALWFTAILFLLMIFLNKKITANMLGLSWLGVIYIPYLLTHVIGLRRLGGGEYYIWLILICAFLTDTCAYFVGCSIGKHKLCPVLSPKKTIEGAVGGVLGCILSCLAFGLILEKFFSLDVDFLRLGFLGLICSIGAQLGDIAASSIKRQYGIKDYGNLIPGHGGILDRCDSILFVAPLMFFYIVYIGIFN